MKKILVLMAAAATVATIASCEKEQNFTTPEEIVSTTVSISVPDTKATLGASDGTSRPVYWNEGDQIVINGSVSNALAGEYEGATSAEFTFGAELSTPYNILYPASIYKDATTITLPAEQEAGTDLSFASNALPMYGYSTTAAMGTIHHLCGILQVNITGSATIAYVQVTGGADEKMSGDFTIDYTTGSLTSTSTYYADKRVKTLVNKTLSSAITPVYVVIPARTYASGLTLRIVDSEGGYMDKTIAGSRTVEAGSLKILPTLEYVSEGTVSAEYIIKTAGEWNAFMAAFNASSGNQTGTVSIEDDFSFDSDTPQEAYATGKAGTNFRYTVYGNGHTIKGLSTVLIFRNYGSIQDLNVEGTNTVALGGRSHIGLLVGWNNGTVKNCTVKGSIIIDSNSGIKKTEAYVGAIGYNQVYSSSSPNVENVTSEVDITYNLSGVSVCAGGVVGKNDDGATVKNSTYQNATMTVGCGSTYAYVGGVVGQNTASGIVQYANNKSELIFKGSYPTDLYYGGVIGYNNNEGSSSVVNSLVNEGDMTFGAAEDFAAETAGSIYLGGVVGYQGKKYTGVSNVERHARNIGNIKAYACRSFTNFYAGGVFGRCTTLQGNNNETAGYAIEFGQYTDPYTRDAQTLEVIFVDNQSALTFGKVGIGGIAGLHGGDNLAQNTRNFNKVYVHGLATSSAEAKALNGIIGIGGIFGDLGETGSINRNKNYGTLEVSLPYQATNTFIGGIAGVYNSETGGGRICNNIFDGNILAEIVQNDGSTGIDAIGVGGIAGAINTTLSATEADVAGNQVSGAITVYGTKATNGDRYFGTLYGYGKDAASGIITGDVTGTMTVYGSAVTATANLVIE